MALAGKSDAEHQHLYTVTTFSDTHSDNQDTPISVGSSDVIAGEN